MSGTTSKKALHVATFSGWYRFEPDGKGLRQTKRDLSYWTLTCLSVDPDDSRKIYAGTEHSGLFYTKDGGAHWHRANPQVPKMFLYSALALDGEVMVGTIPSAVYRSTNGVAGFRSHNNTFRLGKLNRSAKTLELMYRSGSRKTFVDGVRNHRCHSVVAETTCMNRWRYKSVSK